MRHQEGDVPNEPKSESESDIEKEQAIKDHEELSAKEQLPDKRLKQPQLITGMRVQEVQSAVTPYTRHRCPGQMCTYSCLGNAIFPMVSAGAAQTLQCITPTNSIHVKINFLH